jgi:hypothetical protein
MAPGHCSPTNRHANYSNFNAKAARDIPWSLDDRDGNEDETG